MILVAAEDIDRLCIHLPNGLHGRKGFEIVLNMGPLIGILFRDDRRLGIGIVLDEVVLELEGDDVIRVFGDGGQELGIRFIGGRIGPGLDEVSSIEVAIGKIAFDVIVVVEDSAEHIDGSIDAFDVDVLGLRSGTLDCEEFEHADLRQDEDKASIEVAAETGRFAISLPVVLGRCLLKFIDEVGEVRAGCIGWKAALVQDAFRASDVRNEVPHRVAVDADRGLSLTDYLMDVEAVGLKESPVDEVARDFEADVLEIPGGGEATLAELIDVEGELGLDVSVGILGVVDDRTILLLKLGELDRDSSVDCGAVTDVVADVVGKGPDGEGELIGSMRVAEKAEDEVAGADVVGEVGEEDVAEGVIAKVLDCAASVGIGVGSL